MQPPDFIHTKRIPGAINLSYFRPVSGVYFLYLGDVVMYVGQSCNIRQRVINHLRRWGTFTRVTYIPLPAGLTQRERMVVEREWIRRLQPPLNIDETPRRPRTGVPAAADTLPDKPSKQHFISKQDRRRAGRQLHTIRRKIGLTKSQAANILGTSPGAYSGYESGSFYATPELIAVLSKYGDSQTVTT